MGRRSRSRSRRWGSTPLGVDRSQVQYCHQSGSPVQRGGRRRASIAFGKAIPPPCLVWAIIPPMEAAMSDTGIDWSDCPDVERVPGRVSGQWVVKDTRISAQGVIDNAEDFTSDEIATEHYE